MPTQDKPYWRKEVWYKPTHWLVNSRNPNYSLIRQLTNLKTCQPHQLKNLSTQKLKTLLTHNFTNSQTYQLTNSPTQKLINSKTQKFTNSQPQQLKNSSTQKLKLLFLSLQNPSNFRAILAKI